MNIHHQIHHVIELLVRDSIKKWCLYLNFGHRSTKENMEEQIEEDHNLIKTDCRFLSKLDNENKQKIELALQLDGWVLVECVDQQQCVEFYNEVDGDDTGGHIYAATIDPFGEWRNENT